MNILALCCYSVATLCKIDSTKVIETFVRSFWVSCALKDRQFSYRETLILLV